MSGKVSAGSLCCPVGDLLVAKGSFREIVATRLSFSAFDRVLQ